MLLAQLGLAGSTAAITTAFFGWTNGLFVMIGGLAAFILTALAALRAFSVDAATDPHGALRAVAAAEMGKLAGAILFFALVAYTASQHFIPILVGFGVATTSYWLALRVWAGGRE
ncbi:MAG: ATP synthase subunit I [Xanthomonadales bacterium]|nr:ATP synthase subunit I [Xanthomonadales bacterium]